jgi:hypothetical protein
MNAAINIGLCGLCCLFFAGKLRAGGLGWTEEELIAAARVAGIDEQLVRGGGNREELVEALRRRIEYGYQYEKTKKWQGDLREVANEEEFRERLRRRDAYLAGQARGFEQALLLSSHFRCVELVPMLVEMGDMMVLWDDQLSPRSTRAIVGTGVGAFEPLADIIETSPRAEDRYWALRALALGKWAWREELGDESLAERMEKRCDPTNEHVRLALSCLRGEIKVREAVIPDDRDDRNRERSRKAGGAGAVSGVSKAGVERKSSKERKPVREGSGGTMWGVAIGLGLLVVALVFLFVKGKGREGRNGE